MINIFLQFKEIFSKAITEIANENSIKISESDIRNFTLEPAKEAAHGDLACNAAMVLARKFSDIPALNNPRKLAQKLIDEIRCDDVIKFEIAGPGFINIFLRPTVFYYVLQNLLEEKILQFPNLGKGQKINLEYASPNPTGPMHVGHTRGAIYGDVLASLLQKVGFDVLKEYYINDAGSQISTLVRSAYLRYKQACGDDVAIPDGYYPGEYLIEVGVRLKERFGDNLRFILTNKTPVEIFLVPLTEHLDESGQVRDFVIDAMMEMIRSDLLALGIKHDSYFSEKKNLHDTKAIDEAIEILRKKDLIYEGKLELPKTEKGVGDKTKALPEGYEEKDQTLFRSTKFGDDQDRVVKKSDGSLTYFAADLAYIRSKFERGARTFIMPLGADHAGYVKRLSAAVEALTEKQAELKVVLCQMVKFIKNGEPLKMSKRSGNFITAREVIDEVGADALRFIMLTRKNDAPFDFDLAKVIEQSKDNPIFYVQYAHARCASVLRNSTAEGIELPVVINPRILENLRDESELNLIKKIANFPRVIEMAATSYEPHRLAFYLQELAAEFHALWNKGTENPDLKFIMKDNVDVSLARIYLVSATKKIISCGLEIFNIKALEEMR